MPDDPPDDIASEIAAAAGLEIPDVAVVQSIYEQAAVMASLSWEIASREREIVRLRDDYNKLAKTVLPDLFDRVHTDKFGVPGWSADVVLKTVVKANISTEWDDDRQEEGFAELERVGGGDIIRVSVSMNFGKKELALAEEFFSYAERWNGRAQMADDTITMDKKVPWNTLTKFVKEELIAKKMAFDAEKIGATILRQAEIAWRKSRTGATVMERLGAVRGV